jgi:lipopolysaccharide biosynthesis glycosyltransferase
MLRIFIGYDPRVAVQYHVLAHSLLEHTSIPLQIIPLGCPPPLQRKGLTAFTWARFLVPYLCGFEGEALFLDSDMLCTGDIATILHDHQDYSLPVADVACSNAVRYAKTNPAYERAAVMLFDCANPELRDLTPEHIETTKKPLHLLPFGGCNGYLPNRFNFLVGYDDPAWCNGQLPTLIHYTKGVPAWPETADCDFADHWVDARARAFNPAVTWGNLMGHSNHATEGPGGVTIPAPRVPDAVHEPQRS